MQGFWQYASYKDALFLSSIDSVGNAHQSPVPGMKSCFQARLQAMRALERTVYGVLSPCVDMPSRTRSVDVAPASNYGLHVSDGSSDIFSAYPLVLHSVYLTSTVDV